MFEITCNLIILFISSLSIYFCWPSFFFIYCLFLPSCWNVYKVSKYKPKTLLNRFFFLSEPNIGTGVGHHWNRRVLYSNHDNLIQWALSDSIHICYNYLLSNWLIRINCKTRITNLETTLLYNIQKSVFDNLMCSYPHRIITLSLWGEFIIARHTITTKCIMKSFTGRLSVSLKLGLGFSLISEYQYLSSKYHVFFFIWKSCLN